MSAGDGGPLDVPVLRRTVLSAGLIAGLIPQNLWADTAQSSVQTTFGPVRGLKHAGLHVFKGLRYGADTATTRFAAPKPPTPWKEPAEAIDYGPASPQAGSEPNQSEDCLFLNVWTTSLDARAKKPVMVYIHGGAYNTGSGSSPLTDGSRLASEEDVVVVTLNHRLNAFGYLYLGQLLPNLAPDSGNAGQWDLVLALNWVKANIARFGGDPARVMLFGQSGGGAKIASLMAAPATSGLFHAVATMSGQQVTASGPLNATARAKAFLDALKVSPQEVFNVPTFRLIEALNNADPINSTQKLYFGPVLDQRHLPRHPFWPDAPPLSAHIPMILGNMANETRNLIGRSNPAAFSLTFDDLPVWLGTHMRSDMSPAHVIATYQAAYPGITASDLFFAATTAGRSWRGQVEEADARARQGAPTWVYRFDLKSPEDGGKWGAYHTLDIPHAFRTLAASGPMTGTGPDARKVSGELSSALVSLARTGSPQTRGLPSWPRYRLNRRETMIFDTRTRVEFDPRGVERALFQTVPFIQWGS
ncbi:MAG: carboxylesterase/lipase family protein [Hyphomonadaceae bacterium]